MTVHQRKKVIHLKDGQKSAQCPAYRMALHRSYFLWNSLDDSLEETDNGRRIVDLEEHSDCFLGLRAHNIRSASTDSGISICESTPRCSGCCWMVLLMVPKTLSVESRALTLCIGQGRWNSGVCKETNLELLTVDCIGNSENAVQLEACIYITVCWMLSYVQAKQRGPGGLPSCRFHCQQRDSWFLQSPLQ